MGKSLGNAVYLIDDEETIKKKIMGAITDPDKIKEIKDSLKDFNGYKLQYYEISIDYDDNGYVNKITIETR